MARSPHLLVVPTPQNERNVEIEGTDAPPCIPTGEYEAALGRGYWTTRFGLDRPRLVIPATVIMLDDAAPNGRRHVRGISRYYTLKRGTSGRAVAPWSG